MLQLADLLSLPAPRPSRPRLLPPPIPRGGHNRLLATLGDHANRWSDELETVDLPLGKVLHEPGVVMGHAYFPITAIVSLSCVTESGACAEVAAVGNEGVVGISLFMGGGPACNQAVVRSAGQALRLRASAIRDDITQPVIQQQMLRYVLALIAQLAQTVVCNRHHVVEQQLCRLLLLSLDRLPGPVLTMTHELVASLLGVRRESVSEAAIKLQKAGLIRYGRGQIEVLSRAGLERRTCECYAVVKNEYDRLLSTRQPLPHKESHHRQ
jgi:CRP-like cAMP-binding protein